MIEFVAGGIVLGALSLIPIVVLSVLRKARVQRRYLPNPTEAELHSAADISNRWQYVVTTLDENQPYRLWAYGLWQRGWCEPRLVRGQLRIVRQGAASIVIPTSAIRRVVRASSTVGRGVERGGLLGIVWETSGQFPTTWLRAISPQDQEDLKLRLESGLT